MMSLTAAGRHLRAADDFWWRPFELRSPVVDVSRLGVSGKTLRFEFSQKW
jgi:hypothetical protein